MSLCPFVFLSLQLLLHCQCRGQPWYRGPVPGTLQGWHQLGHPWGTPAHPQGLPHPQPWVQAMGKISGVWAGGHRVAMLLCASFALWHPC